MGITLDSTIEEIQTEYATVHEGLQAMGKRSSFDHWVILYHGRDRDTQLKDIPHFATLSHKHGGGTDMLSQFHADEQRLYDEIQKHPRRAKKKGLKNPIAWPLKIS